MAAPAYTTDLALFRDFETAVIFGEFLNWTGGRTQALDTDYPIQGGQHASAIISSATTGSIAVDYGSNITWTTGWNFFMWGVFLAPAAVNTRANGGIAMIVGADVSNHNAWYVGGNDFGSYPYGGWQNFVVDPQVTPSATTGTPGTSYRWVGIGCSCISAVAKGSPQGCDVIRYGRGTIRVAGGETGNYANFTGMASQNDNNSNRWGLFQSIVGGYNFKGLMYIGYVTPAEFTDSDKNIAIDNTLFVQPSFNRIEIHNASSIINWTNINISSLGTVSKGEFEVIDNATVNMDGCTFTDMSTFKFLSNTNVTDSTFRRCAQVTYGGGVLSNCIFESPAPGTSVAALLWNNSTDPNTKLDSTSFAAGTAGHGIEFGPNAPTSITLVDVTSTGYGADGTATAFIHNNSGKALTIYTQGTTNLPTYKNTDNGGTSTTTIITQTVTLTISGLYANSDVWIYKQSDNTQYHSANPVLTADYIDGDGVQRYKTSWTYSAATYGGVAVYIRVYCLGYINQKISYILESDDATLPIQQVVDRNYINP